MSLKALSRKYLMGLMGYETIRFNWWCHDTLFNHGLNQRKQFRFGILGIKHPPTSGWLFPQNS